MRSSTSGSFEESREDVSSDSEVSGAEESTEDTSSEKIGGGQEITEEAPVENPAEDEEEKTEISDETGIENEEDNDEISDENNIENNAEEIEVQSATALAANYSETYEDNTGQAKLTVMTEQENNLPTAEEATFSFTQATAEDERLTEIRNLLSEKYEGTIPDAKNISLMDFELLTDGKEVELPSDATYEMEVATGYMEGSTP